MKESFLLHLLNFVPPWSIHSLALELASTAQTQKIVTVEVTTPILSSRT